MDEKFITYTLEKEDKVWYVVATYDDKQGVKFSATTPLYTHYTAEYLFGVIVPEIVSKLLCAIAGKLQPDEYYELDIEPPKGGFRKSF